MSNQLTTFNFNALPVRVVEREGEPWFVAKDVCEAISISPSEYRRLSDDEKCLLPRTQLGMQPGRPAMLVSESGLYKLIMRSNKPEARAFQDWVTKVVLPAIRKDGAYVMGIKNTSQAVAQINDSRKSMLNIGLPGRAPLAVNEAGLYDLVLQSRKPEAVKFKEWVTPGDIHGSVSLCEPLRAPESLSERRSLPTLAKGIG